MLRQFHSRLLWLALLPLGLAAVVFLLIVVLRAGAPLLPPPSDVFESYRVVMPGQPDAMVARYPCKFSTSAHHEHYSHLGSACLLSPEDSVFRQVEIFTQDHIITGVIFRPRKMRLVELVGRWGPPDRTYRLGQDYRVVWHQPVQAVVQVGPRYTMRAFASFISLTAPGFKQI